MSNREFNAAVANIATNRELVLAALASSFILALFVIFLTVENSDARRRLELLENKNVQSFLATHSSTV